MTFLLDASAIIPLIIKSGKLAVSGSKKANLCTTELGVYEACNGFWRLSTLIKSIGPEDAAEMITVLNELTKRNLKVISVANVNLQETLQVARLNQLTFYDASYLVACQENKCTLVTDDKKLCQAAIKTVESITFNQFQTRIERC